MAAPEVEDRLGDAEQETILLELHRYGEPLAIPRSEADPKHHLSSADAVMTMMEMTSFLGR